MSTRELFAAAECALERGHEGLGAAVCLELRMFGRIVEEVVATTLLRAASLISHYLVPTKLSYERPRAFSSVQYNMLPPIALGCGCPN